MSFIKWDKVLASKDKGGLGVASFYGLNRALITKWIWRFRSQSNSLLSQVLSALHGIDGNLGGNSCFPSNWAEINKVIPSVAQRILEVARSRCKWTPCTLYYKVQCYRILQIDGGGLYREMVSFQFLLLDVSLMINIWIRLVQKPGGVNAFPSRLTFLIGESNMTFSLRASTYPVEIGGIGFPISANSPKLRCSLRAFSTLRGGWLMVKSITRCEVRMEIAIHHHHRRVCSKTGRWRMMKTKGRDLHHPRFLTDCVREKNRSNLSTSLKLNCLEVGGGVTSKEDSLITGVDSGGPDY
nr:RNA-directed DNA polymerase, eukaryota, reverse transcriptase zinc-binding domain protein [Tanacetum cinerariifolium]